MNQNYQIPIKDFKDILSNPSYKLMVVKGSAGETFLKDSTNSIHQRIWKKVLSDDSVISTLENYDRELLKDKFKVLYWVYPEIPMMFESYPCSITASKSGNLVQFGIYPFHKESQFAQLFNYHLTS